MRRQGSIDERPPPGRPQEASAGNFHHAVAFYLGITAITVGVLLHLPMFFSAKDMDYMLTGMGFDLWMIVGMGLIAAGYVAVLYGLLPRRRERRAEASSDVEVRSLDESRLSRQHLKLMAVLTLAVAVDTQKPFTFTFILPGVTEEYGLNSPSHPAPGALPVALFPFAGILGTTLGSLIFGYLGDRIGRRASILLAASVFIGTAMCSVMPAYWQNLVACLAMGLSVGGLLPIAYSLLAETIPVRRRGQVVVLVAGIGTALGFLFASWTADLLIPHFGWRIMWLFGIPTGLALIVLNRYIPESPRFLLAHGRLAEATAVMRSFGVTVVERARGAAAPQAAGVGPHGPRLSMYRLFRPPWGGITLALTAYGLAWGLVNFGFLVWLPVHVEGAGIDTGQVTSILAKAALFSIPGAVVVSWLYGRWSSRGTLIGVALVTAATLAIFVIPGLKGVVEHKTLFTGTLVLLLVALWGMIAVLAPYGAEVYPTRVRAQGSGIVAGASKFGGVLALTLAVFSVAPPGLAGAAILGAIPAALAAVMLIAFGIETRGRRLEEITRAELARAEVGAAYE